MSKEQKKTESFIEKIQRKIDGKFDCIEEILQSVHEYNAELQGNIQIIRYLSWLVEDEYKINRE